MTTLITGGSKCGKSSFAERALDTFLGRKIYIATMQPYCNDALEETKSSIYEYCKYIFSVSSNTTVSIFGYYETL